MSLIAAETSLLAGEFCSLAENVFASAGVRCSLHGHEDGNGTQDIATGVLYVAPTQVLFVEDA